MSEEVKIYPNEIVIGNKSFFGLDKDLVNLVENLTIDKINAELKRDKQKEVLDKIKEKVNQYEFISGYYDDNYDGEDTTYSQDTLKEDILELLEEIE